jgi:hypothetical protein
VIKNMLKQKDSVKLKKDFVFVDVNCYRLIIFMVFYLILCSSAFISRFLKEGGIGQWQKKQKKGRSVI